jgi:subtilisin family serine protease
MPVIKPRAFFLSWERISHIHMILRFVILLILLLPYTIINAQSRRYIITLRDKHHTSTQPALSPKALERRYRQHIATDSTDFPVSPAYLDSIAAIGNVSILYTSRWFNQVILSTSDASTLQMIQALPFVIHTQSEGRQSGARKAADGTYGNAAPQINLHNGQFLHDHNYKGQNMLIAILDGGFPTVDDNDAFRYLRNNNRIAVTWDFVGAVPNVYNYSAHGTQCLSAMAAYLPGEMVGTAPEAGYLLLRTEESSWEKPIEENNWAAAAEYADSAGADIISSSVGYNTFDDPAYNHTYAELDGNTTLIARAASMAASKGMLVVCAAGNEGTTDWHTLLTPADADHVLTVGAVSNERIIAAFSSRGPTADGRIKPDVVSYGVGTQLIGTNGEVMTGSGTSFATPIIAGLAACLWQAFPNATNLQVLNAIKASSDRYSHPDNDYGYGIPDFKTAFDILLRNLLTDSTQVQLHSTWLKALPNPFTSTIKTYMRVGAGQQVALALYDNTGHQLRTVSFTATAEYFYYEWPADFSQLAPGIYYLRAQKGPDKAVVKLVRL